MLIKQDNKAKISTDENNPNDGDADDEGKKYVCLSLTPTNLGNQMACQEASVTRELQVKIDLDTKVKGWDLMDAMSHSKVVIRLIEVKGSGIW